jgi:hypothetical protein
MDQKTNCGAAGKIEEGSSSAMNCAQLQCDSLGPQQLSSAASMLHQRQPGYQHVRHAVACRGLRTIQPCQQQHAWPGASVTAGAWQACAATGFYRQASWASSQQQTLIAQGHSCAPHCTAVGIIATLHSSRIHSKGEPAQRLRRLTLSLALSTCLSPSWARQPGRRVALPGGCPPCCCSCSCTLSLVLHQTAGTHAAQWYSSGGRCKTS